ncbi:26341_t:CDS:2, partial [Gigaspora rosea]
IPDSDPSLELEIWSSLIIKSLAFSFLYKSILLLPDPVISPTPLPASPIHSLKIEIALELLSESLTLFLLETRVLQWV